MLILGYLRQVAVRLLVVHHLLAAGAERVGCKRAVGVVGKSVAVVASFDALGYAALLHRMASHVLFVGTGRIVGAGQQVVRVDKIRKVFCQGGIDASEDLMNTGDASCFIGSEQKMVGVGEVYLLDRGSRSGFRPLGAELGEGDRSGFVGADDVDGGAARRFGRIGQEGDCQGIGTRFATLWRQSVPFGIRFRRGCPCGGGVEGNGCRGGVGGDFDGCFADDGDGCGGCLRFAACGCAQGGQTTQGKKQLPEKY